MTSNPYLAVTFTGVVMALLLAAGLAVRYIRKNPDKARAWALKRQAELRSNGQLAGPRTEALMAGIAREPARAQSLPSRNKFGVPLAQSPRSARKRRPRKP